MAAVMSPIGPHPLSCQLDCCESYEKCSSQNGNVLMRSEIPSLANLHTDLPMSATGLVFTAVLKTHGQGLYTSRFIPRDTGRDLGRHIRWKRKVPVYQPDITSASTQLTSPAIRWSLASHSKSDPDRYCSVHPCSSCTADKGVQARSLPYRQPGGSSPCLRQR